MFQEGEPALLFPPNASPPGSDDSSQRGEPLWQDNSNCHAHADNSLTFSTVCEFWAITSEWISAYYGGERNTALDDLTMEFANRTFLKLLRWSDGISLIQARGVQSSHQSIVFQLRHTFYASNELIILTEKQHVVSRINCPAFPSLRERP